MADATTNIEEESKTKDENESRKGDGSKQVGENGDPTAEEPSLKFESQNPQVDTQKLLEAIKAKNYDRVKLIFKESRKLLIDSADEVGKTVLHYLCNLGCSSEVQLCLLRNPDVNKTDKIGWTALHYAALKGQTEVVKLLVDNGANVNKPDNQKGRTPLHIAVSRNHQEIAETLIYCGADPCAKDQEGKTASELCRSEFMKDKLENASLKVQNELGEVTAETMEILIGQATPFPNIGLTVTHVGNHDTDKNAKSAVDTSAKSFTISIRRISAADKLDDKFTLGDTEELCSDMFTHKLTKAIDPADVEISIPIFTAPASKEELVMKTDKGKEIILTNIKEEDGKWHCTSTVDITSFSSFIVVSRPKLEKFSVGTGSAHIKSAVDERVELNITKGTFDKPVTITMEITEPPQKEDLSRVMSQCADITSTTSFYSLDSGGSSLSKPIAIKVPLPATYTGNGKMLIFTMNDDPAKETPESWKLMFEAKNIKKDRIEFDVKSFSIKVVIEATSPIPSDNTEFGSTLSFGSIASQISRIYRKSRRREHTVAFVCMTRRLGTSNTFRVVVMCCKLDQMAKLISFWEGEGFEYQSDVKLCNNESEIRARAKQAFKVRSKTLDILSEQKEIYISFQPKLEKSYQQFKVTIPSSGNNTSGYLEFYKIERKEAEVQDGTETENEEKVCSVGVTLSTFNPSMMEKLDGRSFLNYKKMTLLQKEIKDNWWKVLLLMDIPFKTLEKTLSDPGNLEEKVNGLLFEWKERNRSDKSRGLPILMSALYRCGKRSLVNDWQRELLEWKNNPKNSNDAFYDWLIMAYKYDLLVPTRYDIPMSDTFLTMLADRIKPTAEVATALSVPAGTLADILARHKTYPTDGMKSMKILDHFRKGMSNKTQALQKLVSGLRDLNLNQEANYVLMMTKAWLKRQQTDEKEFIEVYKLLTETNG